MKILRRFHNGEHHGSVVLEDDGKVYGSNNIYICDYDDEERDDKIEEYIDNWYESHWSQKDWADYYGCDESDLD